MQDICVTYGNFMIDATVRKYNEITDNVSEWENVTLEMSERHLLSVFMGISANIEGYDPFASELNVLRNGALYYTEDGILRNGELYYIEDGGLKILAHIRNAYSISRLTIQNC